MKKLLASLALGLSCWPAALPYWHRFRLQRLLQLRPPKPNLTQLLHLHLQRLRLPP